MVRYADPYLSCHSLTDWVCFLTFNIGNSTVEAVPTGIRVFIGLLQAVSVRNAGFQVVPLAAVAPALKFVVLNLYMAVLKVNVRKGFVRRHDVYRSLPHSAEVRSNTPEEVQL